jgi:hypothetical protein
MLYAGTWHILEMEMWDEDYFNMEVQAFPHRTERHGQFPVWPEGPENTES